MSLRANYLSLNDNVFLNKIEQAYNALKQCCMCAHHCAVNRSSDARGFCGAGKDVEVASWGIHKGEEPPLAEKNGAGAIFFAHCSFKCVYCQNFQISQQAQIKDSMSPKQLASIMLEMQLQGAQNIDLVSPTHFLPQIIEAIYLGKKNGLVLPIVYNTNAYESKKTLKLLSGVIDVYLPDFKYFDDSLAKKYSGINNYLSIVKQSIRLMYEQTGDFTVDDEKGACKGLLVRHLVLPEGIAGSFEVLDFLKNEIGVNIGLSIMSQYAPCYKAHEFRELDKKITSDLYNKIIDKVEDLGFEQCWIQEFQSSDIYFPNFQAAKVFNED